jgi:hypothetical protein
LTLGNVSVSLLANVAYLAALGCIGIAVASRRLSRRLLP